MNWYKQAKAKFRQPGKYWYEYHCYEGHDSSDAELWYHSHQKVNVLSLVEQGFGDTPEERGNNGQPAVYNVRFSDGFTGDAFEDEILDSPSEFTRPDPPKIIA